VSLADMRVASEGYWPLEMRGSNLAAISEAMS